MTPDLTPILSRFSDGPWPAEAQLDDLIRCPLQRAFCFPVAVGDEFDLYLPDRVILKWKTVGDVQRTVKELL